MAALERDAALRRAEAAEAALQAARAEAAGHDATLRRAEAAEADSARLTALVTSLERDAALRRAEAAEEKLARLQSDAATLASCAEAAEARAAALERDARAAVLGKRSAEARADELLAEVATKQARLDAADAAAAAARAAAARATEALEAATTCRVCLSAPRQMVFSPCNHLAVCKACSEELSRRVADRAPVATRVRRAPPPASPPKPRCPVCQKSGGQHRGPHLQAVNAALQRAWSTVLQLAAQKDDCRAVSASERGCSNGQHAGRAAMALARGETLSDECPRCVGAACNVSASSAVRCVSGVLSFTAPRPAAARSA